MAESEPVDLGYKPEKIVMACGDGRFGRAFIMAAKANNDITKTQQPNEIKLPGPSASINDESSRAIILDYIGAFREFFDSSTLSLYDHVPCGWMKKKVPGYGDASSEQQIELTVREQKAAAEIIRQTHPGLSVETHIIGSDGRELAPSSEK